MAENKTLARPYAKSIFNLAKKSDDYDTWSHALELLSFIVNDAAVIGLIKNQTITKTQKADFVIDVATRFVDAKKTEDAKNLILVLAENDRLNVIEDIKSIFAVYKDVALSVVKLKVISAVPIKKDQKNDYQNVLKEYFGKKIEASFATDKNLLGGVVVKAGDMVIDFSLKADLLQLQESLVC